MDWKVIVLLVLVCVGSFGGYLFVNPFVAYDDSFAFVSVICHIGEVKPNLGSDLMWNYVLPVLPCNFFVLKLVLLSLFITSVLSIGVFGENVSGPEGWRAGLFAATLSPLLFMEATKFENDIFGWTLVFVAFAVFSFVFKIGKGKSVVLSALFAHFSQNNAENRGDLVIKVLLCVFAVFLVAIASLMYAGSVLGLVALVLMSFYLIFLAIPVGLQFFGKASYLWTQTPGKGFVAEELPGVGMVPVALLFVALFDMPKKIKWAGFATFIAGFLKAKLMIFALPFLAVGMVELDKKMKAKWKRWPNLTIICLVFVPVYFFIGMHTNPDQQDFDLIQQAIDLNQSQGLPLYNDWSIGWWLTYKGFNTNYRGSFPDPDYNNLTRPFVAVTLKDNNLDCLLVDTSVRLELFYCT